MSAAIFSNASRPTAAALRERILERRSQAGAQAATAVSREQPMVLSPAQERLRMLDDLRPGSTEYLIPMAYRLPGSLDRGALHRALSTVVARHEILRTRFVSIDDEVRQVIDEPRTVYVTEHGPIAPANVDAFLLARQHSFDLATEWPIRADLASVDDDSYVLLLTAHHIAFDGWSAEVLWSELSELYVAEATGSAASLGPVRMQYADYAAAQHGRQTDPQALDYWRSRLADINTWDAPLDRPRPADWDPRGDFVTFTVPAEATKRILAVGEQRRATTFMTLLAAYQTFLSSHWSLSDVVVGTPTSGRTELGTQESIGYFADTLVLRGTAAPGLTFANAVSQTRERTLEAYGHPGVTFGQLIEQLRPARDLAVNPLFQTMLTVTDRPEGDIRLGDLLATPLPVRWSPARFDLTLDLARQADGSLTGTMVYPVALFDRQTIERLALSFATYCARIAADPDRELAAVDSLAYPERQLMVTTWNDTAVPRPDICLPDLLEVQAAATPNLVAVTADNDRLTYGELDGRAGRLAARLRALGVGPESRVAVCLHRSIEMVVALVGVVKAGAAYVPVDPDYPRDRVKFMLTDAGASVVLTQTALSDLVKGEATVLCLDTEDLSVLPATPPARTVDGENAAYVIYTSGSTGRPKGVVNTHRAIVNRLLWMQSTYQLTTDDVVLQKTPFAFDVSVWEFFWPLSTGATLVMANPGGHRDGEYLRDVIARHGVTVCHFVPSMLQAFLQTPDVEGCVSLRDVICSGETLSGDVARTFAARLGARLHNLYGPTEAAIDVTSYAYVPGTPAATGVPIGAPIDNATVYVLDREYRPVPIGVPGELYLGGAGLARGYLDRAPLTAERFVPDPFGVAGARLYRTGDRVRWLSSGNIEFLGRLDYQVKINGHRIELGEIEMMLTQHPEIAAAVVVVDDGRLLAYVVPAEAAAANPDPRPWLKERLPSYLVPARYMWLPKLPLSTHGKIDRKALPTPVPAPAGGVSPTESAIGVESAVADVWATVLGLPAVGAHDGFFDLGGDSIRALRAVGLLRQRGHETTIQDLFRHQTPASLAQIIGDRPAEQTDEDLRVEPFALLSAQDRVALPQGLADAYPVAMLQAGMLYEMISDGALLPYHNVTAYMIDDGGVLHIEALRRAAQILVDRHEVLRTGFDLTSYSEPLQLVHASVQVETTYTDLSLLPAAQQEAIAAATADSQRSRLFDLTQPPLFRLYVHRLPGTGWRLGWVECHPILDGWSHNSLLTELLTVYRAVRDGDVVEPGPVDTGRFADFIALERRAVASPASRQFWAERLRTHTPLRVPAAWADPKADDVLPYDLRVPIGDLLPALRAVGRSAGVPLKSVLLAAHTAVLHRITDERRFHTGVATNGRMESTGGDRVRGMFLNIVPFAVPQLGKTWRELLQATFAEEVAMWPHRRYPAPAMQRDAGDSQPLIDVLFNYLDFHVLDRTTVNIGATDDYSFTNLALVISTAPDALMLSVSPRKISRTYADRLAALYAAVLTAMATDAEADPADVALPDTRMLLNEWSNPVTAPPSGLLHQRFAAQAAVTPHAVAVVFGAEHITYTQLNARANQLAHRLRAEGIGPDSVVGVCLERSVELVVAILAIVKADACYLALDRDDPAGRIAFLLADAGTAALVTTAELAAQLGETGYNTHALDTLDLTAEPVTDPEPRATPENLAYLIYTSGSTGRPKAVADVHSAVVQLVTAQNYARFGPGVTHLLHSPVTFDAATYEIWGALLTGGKLVVAPPGHLLPEALRKLLHDHGVTSIFLTSTLLALVVEHDPTVLAPLHHLYLGGEVTDPAIAARLREALPHLMLSNAYGPTEATTFALVYRLQEALPAPLPIGRPISHTEVYVLDRDLRPVPVGVPGELYLGGAGLARGYLGRPELTAAAFLPHPFAAEPGARLYRTGDRAWWSEDGNVQFLGRLDTQVKISGHRIECGEIESAIAECPAVRQVAVVPYDYGDGDKRLVAYVRCDEPDAMTLTALHDVLRTSLPDYLLPAALVHLDEFPRTPGGKLDRRALPAPQVRQPAAEHVFVPPRTAAEQVIAAEFARALGVREIGVLDDFVGLGGHSLLAMRVAARLDGVHGLTVEVRDILSRRTVAGVAASLMGVTDPNAVHQETVVWFKPAGAGDPVFLIHPGGGSVHWYRELVAELTTGCPIAALQHPGLADPSCAALSIVDLAELYVTAIRGVQPAGPYRIFGWCGGTAVTWEVTRLLQTAGESVTVSLLDPTVPASGEPMDHLLRLRRAAQLFAELSDASAPAVPQLKAELAAEINNVLDDGDPITAEDLDASWMNRVAVWQGQAEAVHGYAYASAPESLRIVLTEEMTSSGHEAMGGCDTADYLAVWRTLAGREVPVTVVRASHIGVLSAPHVRGLARYLDQWIVETPH